MKRRERGSATEKILREPCALNPRNEWKNLKNPKSNGAKEENPKKVKNKQTLEKETRGWEEQVGLPSVKKVMAWRSVA